MREIAIMSARARPDRPLMSGQTPLIGSRISLISKKDIRYEGILYTIYAHEHSVVLQNGAWPRARGQAGYLGREARGSTPIAAMLLRAPRADVPEDNALRDLCRLTASHRSPFCRVLMN